jgi:hypothetical protein
MDLPGLLYSLLTTGAALLATNAAGEFAKGAGKTAWEALKARLAGAHAVRGLDTLDKPAFAETIKTELAKPDIAADTEVLRLAETLRAAIEALPQPEVRRAVDVDTIKAGRDVLIRAVDGLKAGTIDAGQDAVIENVRLPGKP